jgi:hypothetical protein
MLPQAVASGWVNLTAGAVDRPDRRRQARHGAQGGRVTPAAFRSQADDLAHAVGRSHRLGLVEDGEPLGPFAHAYTFTSGRTVWCGWTRWGAALATTGIKGFPPPGRLSCIKARFGGPFLWPASPPQRDRLVGVGPSVGNQTGTTTKGRFWGLI